MRMRLAGFTLDNIKAKTDAMKENGVPVDGSTAGERKEDQALQAYLKTIAGAVDKQEVSTSKTCRGPRSRCETAVSLPKLDAQIRMVCHLRSRQGQIGVAARTDGKHLGALCCAGR